MFDMKHLFLRVRVLAKGSMTLTLLFFLLFIYKPCIVLSQTTLTDSISQRDYLLSRGYEGNTIREVLASAGLLEKINAELFAFIGIDIELKINNSALVSNRWEDSNLLCVSYDTKEGLARCCVELETGRLERFSKDTSFRTESMQNITSDDLESLLISEDKVLSRIEKIVALSGLDRSIIPEKLELDKRFLNLGMPMPSHWRYHDVPEYHGIPSRSSISVRIHVLTGEILGYTLYNMHIPIPEFKQAKITKDEAFAIAANWAKENNLGARRGSETLIYAPKSNVWSANRHHDLFLQEEIFRLCWSIDFAHDAVLDVLASSVYIDALTGEIVGGVDARI